MKKGEEAMEILEAYDATGSFRAAAGGTPKSGRHSCETVARRLSGSVSWRDAFPDKRSSARLAPRRCRGSGRYVQISAHSLHGSPGDAVSVANHLRDRNPVMDASARRSLRV